MTAVGLASSPRVGKKRREAPRRFLAWEPVGLWSWFRPKGLGNLAQALAWVALQ
jgi:hypothetical protein